MTKVRSREALLMAGALQNAIFARSLQSGRRNFSRDGSPLVWFQSAPALCRAGDTRRCSRASPTHGFNPRPLFAER
ncbi:hypothetical protein, partial [Metallibacterium sp.]|uniref:hypothetical protein n=1 Tax=Metallibacterium sp. TaxID=2940281 RepID=UPI00261F910B